MSQLANNPKKISAADVAAAPLTVFNGWCKISHFEFSDYTAGTTDSATLNDLLGNTVWDPTGATDKEEVRSGRVGDIYGLVVPTAGISTGNVLVYFE
jgi:hypothetical protein